ncbi:cell wall protein [Metarhizium acridum CQMa 102]|uniref:Cell wall protein n=1 Tax=Metarhizium acridum (strain CQMa 102) TaxID=655827 RepID=E9E5I5_METAQ|nr:cell wall protein [Metarhizium acridum CQMa 102]EFY88868.1 cell wall protein [Metarhizium acridum CQMa 102]
MQLTKLIIFASAALGAVAQYDDGLYDEAVYEDSLYDNIDEYAIGAAVYKRPNGGFPPRYLVQHWNKCEKITPPIGGDVQSIRVPHGARCALYRDPHCQHVIPGGVYGPGLKNVGGLPRHAHFIKCHH